MNNRKRSHKRNRTLVFELFGFPGAGKTTIARHLVECLSATYAQVGTNELIGRNPRKRIVHGIKVILLIIRSPVFAWRAFRLAWSTTGGLSGLGAGLSLLRWKYRINLVGSGCRDVVVLDQGILQLAWAMSIGQGRVSGILEPLLRSTVNIPGVRLCFVRVDVDPGTAASRVANRPSMTSRFDHMPLEEARCVMLSHEANLEAVWGIAKKVFGTDCVVLDGRKPAQYNAHFLAKLVAATERASDGSHLGTTRG